MSTVSNMVKSKPLGGGRGGKPQQTAPTPAPATAPSQPKMNAWSKPLQAAKKVAAPPPGFVTGAVKPGRTGTTQAPRSAPSPLNNLTSSNNGTNSFPNALALRERFVHLMTTLTGQKVTISLKSGAVVSGVLHTATPFSHLPAPQRNKYVLKSVVVDKEPTKADAPKVQPGQTLIIDMSSVVQLHLKSIRVDQLVGNNNQNVESAFTDSEISKAALKSSGPRELVQAGSAWTSGGSDTLLDSANDRKSYSRSSSGDNLPINSRAAKLAGGNPPQSRPDGALKGSIAGWDQFKANEELFNVSGTYDESVYTTALDKSTLEADKVARAEKLAREIETSTTANPHLAEERGQTLQSDFDNELDEEDKYSGVLTKSLASRLTEPREPSGKEASPAGPAPTVPKTQQTPKPKLNYAQAVAAAKQPVATAKQAAPPGFGEKSKASSPAPAKKEEAKQLITEESAKAEEPKKETPPAPKLEPVIPKEEKAKEKEVAETKNEAAAVASKPEAEKSAEETKKDTTPAAEAKKEEEKPKEGSESKPEEDKPKSKLNANAKEFSLNIAAKPFVPPSVSVPPPQSQPQQHMPPQQTQPHYVDPHTGMPVGMPGPYGHMQHPMAAHHMMGAPMMNAHHHPQMGQYAGMRGYPYPGMEPHNLPQQGPPPPPPPPPTANNTAPTTASTVTSTHTSGANTPVASEDGVETPPSVSQHQQPQDGSASEGQTQPPPPPPQQQQPVLQQGQMQPHMQWQPQQQQYYGGPMHPGQQQQRLAGPYPPQQFMHHPGMGMPMRQMHGPMGGPPPMRGPQGIPYYPGPPHMGGPYPPYGVPVGYGVGMDGDDQGGNYGRGGPGGGRGGGRSRGGRGRGRGGRSRGGGRFNNQNSGQYNTAGSQPGSGRQTPQGVNTMESGDAKPPDTGNNNNADAAPKQDGVPPS